MSRIEALVEGVFVGDRQDTLETNRQRYITVAQDGIVGDKHRGVMRSADSRVPKIPRGTPIPNTRMWSGVEKTELAEIASNFNIPQVLPEWLGANFVLSGIARFSHLLERTVLEFPQGTELLVDSENMPCTGPGEVIAAKNPDSGIKPNLFQKHAIHRRGLVGTVQTPGNIAEGDTVTIYVDNPRFYSIPPEAK